MNVLKKNLWTLFSLILIGGTVFLCIASYMRWDSINSKYEIEQTSLVKIFSNATNSLFLSQEMMIDILGKQLIQTKNQQILDDLLEMNPSMIGFGLVDVNGTTILASSNMDVKKLPNLIQNPQTRETFLEALNSHKMILGRTYFFKTLESLVIPVRKALRDKDGKVLYVMVSAMKIKGASKLFNNSIHLDKYNEVSLIRDNDHYFQFISSDRFSDDVYNSKVPDSVFFSAVEKIQKKYHKSLQEIKDSEDTYVLKNHTDRFDQSMLMVVTYDKRYGLWTSSAMNMEIMYQEFLMSVILYGGVFLAVHILLFFIFKVIADTESKKQGELIYQATHDALTTLPNREYLRKYSDEWINEAEMPFAVIYIDIDNFKSINDNYGHYFGDQLLVEFGKRLQKLNDDNSLIARQGSDEFLVLYHLDNKSTLETYIHSLVSELSKPYYVNEINFTITLSVGAGIYPKHGKTLDELALAVDIAMFESKKQKNSVTLFESNMYKQYTDKIHLEHELKNALKDNQFYMMYQPQVNEQGKIYGVEALIRWNNKKRGFVPPDVFIPVAEASGAMVELGRFIVKQSLKEIYEVSKVTKIDDLTLSLNISVKQFMDSNFLNSFQEEIYKSQFNISNVVVEITESLFIEDIRTILLILDALHVKGVRVSLDDFGTGYSSLSMLRNLPIDELKIDKSFVDHIIEDKSAENMIKNIMAIGKNLNMELIAEGVETKEQRDCLLSYGCKHFQGYYFSKPLKKEDLIAYIEDKKA